MSYYGSGGYPPAGGGNYPPQGGYPMPSQQQPGMAQPPYSGGYNQGPPVSMPQPNFSSGGTGGLPYGTQPPAASGGYPPGIGFDSHGGSSYPPQGGGYPQGAPGSAYPPPSGGYSQPSPYGGGSAPAHPGGAPGHPQQPYGGGAPGQAPPSNPYSAGYPQTGPAGGQYTSSPYSGGSGGSSYPSPQQGSYPAAGGYGQPPAHSAGSYPAMGSGQQMSTAQHGQGTVRPHAAFNAEEDCKVLRKAMKGLGTDERAIIEVLTNRSNQQRQQFKLMYKTMFGRDLIKDLKSELSSRLEQTVLALMQTPAEYDASELRKAMSGAGTDEEAIIEILCSRTNRQIIDAKTAYKQMFGRDLERDLISDTSGHFRKLLVALSTGNRQENVPVDFGRAQRDAQELYQAGEKRWGTDESKFNQILCAQSYEQLRAVFTEYHKVAQRSLEESIMREMSGDLRMGMLAIVSVVNNKHRYFADRIYKATKGAGTNDNTLIRAIVSRCEVDMVQIKQEFMRAYGKTLDSFVADDTSGDYKKILMGLVRG